MLRQQRLRDEEEFDAAFDPATGMIRPGVTRVVVPIHMADSAGNLPTVRDRAPKSFGQPGFVADATAANSRKDVSRSSENHYAAYDARVSDAWKAPVPNSSITGIGSSGFVGARPGDRCTVRRGSAGRLFGTEGSDGRLQLIGGQLECVADGHEVTAAEPFRPAKPETYDPSKGAIRRHGSDADTNVDDTDHSVRMDRLYAQRDAALSRQYLEAK